MAQERVRFTGDPEIPETGSGKGPDIPLNKNIQGTSVEMLQDTDDDLDGDDDGAPPYSRERIAARIGTPVEETQKVAEVEKELDDGDVVPCLFQKPLQLQDRGIFHKWGAGTHLVPVSLAGKDKASMHWWLRVNKVKRVGKLQPKPDAEDAA